MNTAWLDRYVEAWRRHPEAGGEGGEEALTALLAFMSDDVRYEDVPTGAVFFGHDGIRQMGAGALQMAADMSFEIGQRVAGQGSYAFETVCRARTPAPSVRSPGPAAPSCSAAFRSARSRRMASSPRNGITGIYAGLLGQLGVASA